jgi:hypothetical protein
VPGGATAGDAVAVPAGSALGCGARTGGKRGEAQHKVIGRIIGWLMLLAALAVLGRDLVVGYRTGVLAPVVVGQLWFDLDRASLNLVQAVIQRYLTPWLWDPVVTTFLFFWAAPTLAVPGLLLLWLCRRRRGARRRR